MLCTELFHREGVGVSEVVVRFKRGALFNGLLEAHQKDSHSVHGEHPELSEVMGQIYTHSYDTFSNKSPVKEARRRKSPRRGGRRRDDHQDSLQKGHTPNGPSFTEGWGEEVGSGG